MHCKACDQLLNPREVSRKYMTIEEFIDLCGGCTAKAGIYEWRENSSLKDDHDDEEVFVVSEEEIGLLEELE